MSAPEYFIKYNSSLDYLKMSEREVEKCMWLLTHINMVENMSATTFEFGHQIMMHKQKLKKRMDEHLKFIK